MTKPGFAPYIDVFKIDRRRPTVVPVELAPVAGVLKLHANVESARVYVDGKFVGEAPITTEMGLPTTWSGAPATAPGTCCRVEATMRNPRVAGASPVIFRSPEITTATARPIS